MKRLGLLLLGALFLAGCGGPSIQGKYRDVDDATLTYEFRGDGTWEARKELRVAVGVFPHGSSRKLQGTFRRTGNTLQLICTGAFRQDPLTGEFRKEQGDLSPYNHRFEIVERAMRPLGTNGSTSAVFASDINPLGAAKIVMVEN